MINFTRLIQSFRHAFSGLHFTLTHNQNLRIHFVIAIVVVIASIMFHVNPFEMGILGVMILLVICTEMINTSIEEMVNFVTAQHQREAKIAKDVSAGMVLVAALGSIIVGVLIFLPHILRLFQ